jgi:iron complex transport system substrate-binding protein
MHRFGRRQFLATALTSAVVASCARQNQSKSNTPSSTPANRIVALEWVYVEDLLALGIQPIGVADIRGYKTFVDIEPTLAETVVDVGTRQEPSLEAIAQLQPDLIIGTQLRHEAIYDSLSAIAPTLLFNPYPDSNALSQFDEMQQTFRAIAERVNRRDAGEAVLRQMQDTFKAASDRLKSTNQKNNSFILGQFNEATPQIRLFTDNAMAVQILNQIGLENVWKGQIDRFGFNTVGIEAFPKLEQANFLYIAAENNTHLKQLQNNPVWKGLQFVQEKRLYSIGAETWVFGGPKSAQVLVEKVTTALTRK